MSQHLMLCIHRQCVRAPGGGWGCFSFLGARIEVANIFATEPKFIKVSAIPTDELPGLTRWVAEHGGRDLLDAWELLVLNSKHSAVKPVVEVDGGVIWEAERLFHEPGRGLLIRWLPQLLCDECDGTGYKDPGNLTEVFDDDEDEECSWCGGDGFNYGFEVVTDVDGIVVHDAMLEAA